MPEWEYYVHHSLRFTSNESLKIETQKTLNKIGENGWEMVSVFPGHDQDVSTYIGIFKRKRK